MKGIGLGNLADKVLHFGSFFTLITATGVVVGILWVGAKFVSWISSGNGAFKSDVINGEGKGGFERRSK